MAMLFSLSLAHGARCENSLTTINKSDSAFGTRHQEDITSICLFLHFAGILPRATIILSFKMSHFLWRFQSKHQQIDYEYNILKLHLVYALSGFSFPYFPLLGKILYSWDKQECIPVGCVPSALYRMGVPWQTPLWTETPWIENPLDRDPRGRDPLSPRQNDTQVLKHYLPSTLLLAVIILQGFKSFIE